MSDADKDQLAVERNSEMTVGMSLKLAYMTRAQAVEQAWREAELQIRDADAARQETEDTRSRRRNRNRLGVLAAGFAISLSWPTICTALNMSAGKQWTTAIFVIGEILVTLYAFVKRY